MLLRAGWLCCYALASYAATRWLAMLLRAGYAMSGTDIPYAVSVCSTCEHRPYRYCPTHALCPVRY
eukprot:312540-Rhodomonas_salina.1